MGIPERHPVLPYRERVFQPSPAVGSLLAQDKGDNVFLHMGQNMVGGNEDGGQFLAVWGGLADDETGG